jgi:hypothetical protein
MGNMRRATERAGGLPDDPPVRFFGTDPIGHDLGTVLPLRGRAKSKTTRKKGVHLGA